MKITSIGPHNPATSTTGPGSTNDTTNTFQKLLDDRLRLIEESSAVARTERSPVASTPATVRLDSLELADTLLATLDSYQDALRRPDLAAPALEPFIGALEDGATGLLALKERFPQHDDPLAKIAEQIATVSLVEAAKYRRGDYNA